MLFPRVQIPFKTLGPVSRKSRKAICETANRLFWRAEHLTCFQGTKRKITVKFDNFISSPFLRCKGNCDTPKMARKVSGLFEKRAPGLDLFLVVADSTLPRFVNLPIVGVLNHVSFRLLTKTWVPVNYLLA